MMRQWLYRVPTLVKGVSGGKPSAVDLLTRDHMRIELLFIQIGAARDPRRKQNLFLRVREELEEHADIEQAIAYPAFEKIEELKPRIGEFHDDHKRVKKLLADISGLSAESPAWTRKFETLMNEVREHAAKEEEEVFPRVRHLFSPNRLERMAEQIKARKEGREAKPARPAKAA